MKTLAVILALLLGSGCASQPPQQGLAFQEGLMASSISAVYPGPLDFKNRYLSSVAIHTNDKRTDGSGHCSGILVSPRDILTAGHCVCPKRSLTPPHSRDGIAQRLREAMPSTSLEGLKSRILANAETIVDSTDCAAVVRVDIIEYLPHEENAESSLRQTQYIGRTVHPHPKLLVIDDATGASWYREADLALIHLATPVNKQLRPIKLPEREVQVGNPVIMVGVGFGEDGGITNEFGDRHSAESIIQSVERMPSGSVKFIAHQASPSAKPVPRVYGGDSGGGCFSKADDRVLIGVISAFASDGESSIFTSVFAYKDWLKEELNHANAATVAP